MKLYYKKSALVGHGKHLGLFKDNVGLGWDMKVKIAVDYGEDNTG